VLYIADDDGPDLAFVQLKPMMAFRLADPIPLSTKELKKGSDVVVIGYPAFDDRNNVADQQRIFGDVYEVKRLSPGRIRVVGDTGFEHDCTTLGGSSGSVVLDLDTGEAVGLHFGGEYLNANYAVSAAEIRKHFKIALSGGNHIELPKTKAKRVEAVPHEAPSAASLANRKGYDEEFLDGFTVTLPVPGEQLSEDIFDGGNGIRLDYTHSTIAVNTRRRMAAFTAVNIDGEKQKKVKESAGWSFDPRVDKEFQIGEELYSENSLDRGHLVRRLDPVWGTQPVSVAAERDTFFFTNCTPQVHRFNDVLWGDLEDYLLYNARTIGFRATIFSGPVFRESDPEYREVLIPQAFWKVAVMRVEETGIDDGPRLSATAYVVSQAGLLQNLEFAYGEFLTYQVPLKKVSALTDLDFGDLVVHDPLNTNEGAAGWTELTRPGEIVL
jgi:endonuclease G, mitochondrial